MCPLSKNKSIHLPLSFTKPQSHHPWSRSHPCDWVAAQGWIRKRAKANSRKSHQEEQHRTKIPGSNPICSMYGIFTYKTGCFFGANVGKSSSTMEHMGMIIGVVKMGISTGVSLLGSSRYGTSLPDIFVDCFRGRVLSRNCVSNQNDLCCIYSEFFQFRKTRSTEMWKTYQTYQTWKS